MKWRITLLAILMISFLGVYADNVSVELIPNEINVNVGETFNLDLVVKNVPEDTKCGGFDAYITYDSSLLNLTDIQLSDVANSANLKDISVEDGKISLMWFSNNPYGNFTIATLTFKALNEGSGVISLSKTAMSDTNGFHIEPLILRNSNITILKPKSDLTVTNISANLKAYEENTINVTVGNVGEVDASNVSVDFYVDSEKIGSETIDSLKVNETKTVTFTFTPKEEKNYTFVAVMDPNNEIDEKNESNNKFVKVLYAVEESIALGVVSTSSVKTGETFTVDIKLDNITDKRPAKGLDGVLVYNPDVLNCTNFEFLVNASEELKNVTFEKGKVTFSIMDGNITKPTTIARATFKAINVGSSVIALTDTVVSDINGHKFNKIITNATTVTVEGPDLCIENISVDNPYYMEPAVVKIKVSNKGHANSVETFNVHLYIDSEDLGVKDISNLSVGTTKIIEFNWTPTSIKNYTIVATIDPTVDENTSNNKLVKIVTITERPIALNLISSTNLTKTDETFTVDIKLDNIADKRPAKGIDGILLYNPDVLNCTNFEFLVNASEELKNVTFEKGKVTFSIMDGNITKPTTIARATFKAINVGSSVIALDGVAISDIDGYKFNKIVVNSATVTVEGPDACIEDITVENPYYREPAVVKVKVSNKGHTNSTETFDVHLYIDSEDLGVKEISNLSVGETKVVEFNWTPTHIKNYTIVATIDPTVDENTSNNKLVKIVTITERPIALNLISSTNLTKTDETFTVDIKLDNITDKRPAKGLDGVLVYNPDVLNCTNFEFLVNASEELKNVTFEKGKVTFSIMDGNITKPTTIARATFKAIDIGKSEIMLSDVKVSDANGYKFNSVVVNSAVTKVEGPNINVQVTVNDPAIYRINNSITVTVTNNGHKDITIPFDVRAYINSEELGNATIGSLKSGESKTVTFNWTPTELRKYTIVIIADSSNSIKEEDEDDNKVVKTVKVVEIPVFIKMYKALENGNSITAKIEVGNINEKRPVGGYDLKILLKNLTVVDVKAVGISNWSVSNNTLFVSGYNISEIGNFEVGEITFNITNSTYSAIATDVKLSDTGGHKFLKVCIQNGIINLGDIKKIIKIDNETEKSIKDVNLIIGDEFNITKLTLDTEDDITIPIVGKNITINKTVIDTLREVKEKAKKIN
ncbi:CARDB domain-containing protein, partial [Methanotorris formicicus]